MSALQKQILPLAATFLLSLPAIADPLPPDASYRPLPTIPFDAVKANDEAEKPLVMQRQQDLLSQRYDLSDRPIAGCDDVGRPQAGPGRRSRQAARGRDLG